MPRGGIPSPSMTLGTRQFESQVQLQLTGRHQVGNAVAAVAAAVAVGVELDHVAAALSCGGPSITLADGAA